MNLLRKMVQTVKNVIKKCHESKSDIDMDISGLRATPIEQQNIAKIKTLRANKTYREKNNRTLQ